MFHFLASAARLEFSNVRNNGTKIEKLRSPDHGLFGVFQDFARLPSECSPVGLAGCLVAIPVDIAQLASMDIYRLSLV